MGHSGKRKWFIRLARPADAQELTNIINEAYRGEGGWTTEKHLVDGQRATLAEVAGWLQEQEADEEGNSKDNAGIVDQDGETNVNQTRQTLSTRCQHEQPIFVAVRDTAAFLPGDTDADTSSEGNPHKQTLLGCIQPSRLKTSVDDDSAHDLSHISNAQKETRQQRREAMLGLFAVSPAYQSHGIGKALLEYALRYMQATWNTTICIITVIDVRQEIIRWYEKQGFTWDGVTTKPFVLPELSKAKFQFRVMEKALC